MKLGEFLFMLHQGDPNKDIRFKCDGKLVAPIALSRSVDGATIFDLSEDEFELDNCSNLLALEPENDAVWERRSKPR